MRYLLLVTFLLSACASISPMQKKQETILNCIKDLKNSDIDSNEAYEICRQVYRLKKLKE